MPWTMSNIDVKLFAILRDRFEAESISVESEPAMTAGGLLDKLSRTYPAQAAHLSVCRVAVNREFAASEDSVNPADEVALIPPVSGG